MTTQRAARLGGSLFVMSGLLTLVNNQLPGGEALDLALLNAIGAGAVAMGFIAWFAVPWERLPVRATMSLPFVGLVLIGIANSAGGVTGQSFSAYFILLAAYIGATQPRWTTAWFSLPMAGVYIYALTQRPGTTSAEMWSVADVIPVCILVGEVLAGALATAGAARAESDRRAALLEVTARSARAVSELDPRRVLRAVADASVELGYDGVSLELFDPADGTYRCVESRGLPPRFIGAKHPTDEGITGEVFRQRAQVVVDDYSNDERAHADLRTLGFKVVVGTPIWTDGELIAVLNVGTRCGVHVVPAELEALVLLADQAGHALGMAELYEQEQREHRRYRRESLLDPLSGLGNRRTADQIVETARNGDAIAMLDFDNFKQLNDEHGHSAGDLVIAGLGGFLRTKLRGGDVAARYGGEEFVIVLRRPGLDLVDAIERLRFGWLETNPAATFSVGTAIVRMEEPARAALGRADASLLDAKAAGKNCARHADLLGYEPAGEPALAREAGES
jgi:diguanylate cyclase (GGDEF)-like protein